MKFEFFGKNRQIDVYKIHDFLWNIFFSEKNREIEVIFLNFLRIKNLVYKIKFSNLFQVKDVEDQISQRKAEVEKLIQEMREVNMESLAISPPEESQQFLDGKYFLKRVEFWICAQKLNNFLR